MLGKPPPGGDRQPRSEAFLFRPLYAGGVWRSVLAAAAVGLLLYLLYFFGLNGAGLLGPDEPRYAAIGRQMALSGDWVTPRLWGEPWFEKPALLYWMTAIGFLAGLGPELAPRLPVALTSVAFLVFFQRRLEREFGRRASCYATAMLATSAGWLAFSQVAVMDLPLAAAFSASLLVSFDWIRTGSLKAAAVAGLLLGLAILAKGLVPLALAIPLVWFGRRRRAALVTFGATALLSAAPWYLACAALHGRAFLEEFFWRHHVERFASETIQHVQPFWFYLPVLAAGLAPWTPLSILGFRQELRSEARLRLLLACFLFGFVFFSAATNKLPGYLLPLFPALCAVLGRAAAEAPRLGGPLAASAVMLALAPWAAAVLPEALRVGLSRAERPAPGLEPLVAVLLLAGLVWWWERAGKRDYAFAALTAGAAAGVLFVKLTAMAALDREVSARALWREIEPRREQVCLEPVHRSLRYGLNYYSLTPLPGCEERDLPFHVRQEPGRPAELVPAQP